MVCYTLNYMGDVFDWDYVAEHCDGTPASLYQTTFAAYRKPLTTSPREAANDLAYVARWSENTKHKQVASFVLLMMIFKLVRRDENFDIENHTHLTQCIRDAWDALWT